MTLVLDAAFLSLCVAPLYYSLNYYCVTCFIKEESFRPKTFARLVALTGIIVVLVTTLICAAYKFKLLK